MPLKELTLKTKFHSYWHCGSGSGASAETDLTPVRDSMGLPYVPGRTLKGLLRDAALQLSEFGRFKKAYVKALFGGDSASSISHRYRKSDPGVVSVGSAIMADDVSRWLEHNPGQRAEVSQQLFRRLQMTAVQESTGTALSKSLRVVDVAIPMELTSSIQIPDDKSLEDALKQSAAFVQAIGAFRHRGLGQATLSFA